MAAIEQRSNTPVRAGLFASPDHAETAVEGLLADGFDPETISVVCRDPEQRERFTRFLHGPLETETCDHGLGTAAKAGLGVGGAAALVELAITGGLSVFVIGAFAAFAIAGTFAALLIDRGISDEVAEFYEQSVQAGEILIAVDIQGDDASQRRQRAEQVLRQAGSRPLPLTE